MRPRHLQVSLAAGLFAIAFQNDARGGDSEAVSFSREVLPILVRKCQACHGPEKAKGGYRLHTFELLLKPGESKEKPVIPGDPEKSHLYQLITASDEDDRMPQKDEALPSAQITLIKRWIKEGAAFDGVDQKAVLALPRAPFPKPPEKYPRPAAVFALALSPDGREMAVGGYHEINFFDREGKLLRRIGDLAQRTHDIAYSPDGSRIAAATGTPGQMGEAVLLDAASGNILKRIAGAGDVVLTVAYSGDGKQLACAGADNSIHLCDAMSGNEHHVIQQHADWILGIAFSHDGSRIASASRDRTARVFNTRSGELETTYAGHEAAVTAVAFSADDKFVYSAGRDKKIHSWNATDGKKANEISGFDDDILRILLADEKLFVCSANAHVREYATRDRKLIRSFDGQKDWVYALAVEPEKHLLVSGCFDGQVRTWNLDDGTETASFTASPGW